MGSTIQQEMIGLLKIKFIRIIQYGAIIRRVKSGLNLKFFFQSYYTWPANVCANIRNIRNDVEAVYVLWVHSLCDPHVTPMIPIRVKIDAKTSQKDIKLFSTIVLIL